MGLDAAVYDVEDHDCLCDVRLGNVGQIEHVQAWLALNPDSYPYIIKYVTYSTCHAGDEIPEADVHLVFIEASKLYAEAYAIDSATAWLLKEFALDLMMVCHTALNHGRPVEFV